MPSRKYREVARSFDDNPRQLEAYRSSGSVVVVAGPGSGKTRLLTVKAAQLLDQEIGAYENVACITFSNECRVELQKRFRELEVAHEPGLVVATVHGFCLRHVVMPFAEAAGLDLPYPLRVASDAERVAAGERALAATVSADERWLQTWEPQVELFRKSRGKPPPGLDDRVPALAAEYEAQLRRLGLIDFDDITNIAAKLVCDDADVPGHLVAKFPVIVVDEYQDLGAALHEIIVKLHDAGARVFAVGDPDQCVYEELQSARPELLRQFGRLPGVTPVELDVNYRSSPALVRASTAVLGRARSHRAFKTIQGNLVVSPVASASRKWADRRAAHAEFVTAKLLPKIIGAGADVRPGDVGLLVTDRHMATELATRLSLQGLPYVRLDRGLPYERTSLIMWLARAIEWCNLTEEAALGEISLLKKEWASVDRLVFDDPALEEEWAEALTFLMRRHGENVLLREWLADFERTLWTPLRLEPKLVARESDALAALKAACEAGALYEWTNSSTFCIRRGPPTHFTIVTLHSAKGLEFPITIMPMCDEGVFPRFDLDPRSRQYAQSLRLFYVGVTRAEHSSYFTYTSSEGQSPFLKDLRGGFHPHS